MHWVLSIVFAPVCRAGELHPQSEASSSSGRNPKRARTAFTVSQLRALEYAFRMCPYPDSYGREQIARVTGISEAKLQVKFNAPTRNGDTECTHSSFWNCMHNLNKLTRSMASMYCIYWDVFLSVGLVPEPSCKIPQARKAPGTADRKASSHAPTVPLRHGTPLLQTRPLRLPAESRLPRHACAEIAAEFPAVLLLFSSPYARTPSSLHLP